MSNSFIYPRFNYLITRIHNDNWLFQCFFFLIFTLLFVQGNVEICNHVQPPFFANDLHNCSLVCSLKFGYAMSGLHNDEHTLCVKNTTIAVYCKEHVDCRAYHIGAYCKSVPCLCKADHAEESYIIRSQVRLPKISTCVVPERHVNPNLPVVPFPWRTLLYVAAIVFLFASCLVCLRWLSPLIRSMQLKRSTQEGRERQATGDNASLFSPVPNSNDNASTPFTYYFPRGIPRIYRATPRRYPASSRARYVTCAQAEGTLSAAPSNQDKPPPYETAIQLPPPAYEDVERAIMESGDDYNQRSQQVEVHVAPPTCSTSQPVHPLSQS